MDQIQISKELKIINLLVTKEQQTNKKLTKRLHGLEGERNWVSAAWKASIPHCYWSRVRLYGWRLKWPANPGLGVAKMDEWDVEGRSCQSVPAVSHSLQSHQHHTQLSTHSIHSPFTTLWEQRNAQCNTFVSRTTVFYAVCIPQMRDCVIIP